MSRENPMGLTGEENANHPGNYQQPDQPERRETCPRCGAPRFGRHRDGNVCECGFAFLEKK
jgi:hypothetical protein